jgi:hypothetical protein
MNKTFTDIASYQSYNQRRAEAIRKNFPKTAETAAKFMAAKARAYAPMNSGKLKSNIIRRKNVVSAYGSNPKDKFPYIHWVNQTRPEFVTMNVKLKGKRKLPWVTVGAGSDVMPVLVRGGKMTYGLQPSNWRWTGRAGFFKLAFGETRQHYNWWVQKARKRSLTAEFI